jgi:lysophospholipase L1-like esterase
VDEHAAVDRRICFIGDSYVAGVGDPSMLGWVGRVAAAAAAEGLSSTSYNLGVRGQTGPQIAERVTLEVPPRLGPADDPRLVVSFGANDTVEVDRRRRATLAESVAAVEHIHSSVDVPLFVVGPPAVGDVAQNRRLDELDTALRMTAGRLGVPYVALHEVTNASPLWHHEIAGQDGYHPGAAGYELIADTTAPDILRWLRSD